MHNKCEDDVKVESEIWLCTINRIIYYKKKCKKTTKRSYQPEQSCLTSLEFRVRNRGVIVLERNGRLDPKVFKELQEKQDSKKAT